jgi:hypothetical protein
MTKTHNGYPLKATRPTISDLQGCIALNGIANPKTGVWVVWLGGVIRARHVAEIAKRSAVLPTLWIADREGGPIVQVEIMTGRES